MSDLTRIPAAFRLPEPLWERLSRLLPPEPQKPRGGRPRADAPRCTEAILFVLKTGIEWMTRSPSTTASSALSGGGGQWMAVSPRRRSGVRASVPVRGVTGDSLTLPDFEAEPKHSALERSAPIAPPRDRKVIHT